MTASELYEIVKDWPEDSWPHAVMQIGKCWHVDTLPVPLEAATALFRDSGLRWLLDLGYAAWQDQSDGTYRVGEWNCGASFVGTDMLHAISAAISTIKKEQENG